MTVPALLRDTLLGEVVLALGILAAAGVASQLVVFIFNRALKAVSRRTSTVLDDLLIQALGRPIFLSVLAVGLFASLTTVDVLDPYQSGFSKGLLVTELAFLVYGANRATRAVLTWYAEEVAPRTESTVDERLIPIVRRVATIAIYGLGALMVIRATGIDVTPLLAGLGIGGLAMALALQPTLNNLIAGAYTISESKIGVGDYIRLHDGPQGMVVDIGWRTTKIRTSQNNIVVIPNARLADSIVENFAAPTPQMVAIVQCGVSYDSDLERVQRVAEEVARRVLQTTPGAVADATPVFRLRAFGDSNIDFEVLLQVQGYPHQYPVVNAFIKALHQRFQAEGIEINYPVRRLIYTPVEDTARSAP